MTVIAAASVKVATLVDGTLRVTMDVEPKDAQAAFALFAKPGTPMALAALKSARAEAPNRAAGGHARAEALTPERRQEIAREGAAARWDKQGPLCQWAVMRCQDSKFRQWLGYECAREVEDEEQAKEIVCNTCGIESRKELDENEAAAKIFHMKVREPYARWLAKQGQPA